MINIKKFLNDKKNSSKIVIAASILLFICTAVVIMNRSLSKAKKNVSKDRSTRELINRLDNLIVSINKKSESSGNKGALGRLLIGKKGNKDNVTDEQEEVSLIGIIWDINKPLALINDQLLSVGEHINGFELIGIEKESITLQNENGERWAIRLI